MGIVHHNKTIGNSKANGQVDKTIWILNDCICHGLVKEAASFWMNHLASALLLLHMEASQMMGIATFLLVMGCHPLLPSLAIPGLLLLSD